MNWLKAIWRNLKAPMYGSQPMVSTPSRTATTSPREPVILPDVSFSSFTPRAQQVLALSRSEADRFHHNFVGTEHLLLGLIRLGQGTAVNVLRRAGLGLDSVRAEVEKQIGAGPDQRLVGTIPFTPRVRKVLALATKEARTLNHTYVGTEHLLLGLLLEGDGVAARVLKNLDANPDQLRQMILQELDPNFTAAANPSTSVQRGASAIALASEREAVDLTVRYDIQCAHPGGTVVVHSNMLIKGVKTLFPKVDCDTAAEFVELEQPDGTRILVAGSSIVSFQKHSGPIQRPECPQ